MKFSKFGDAFNEDCGIVQLMDDLGTACHRNNVMMLGGGNPASIDAVNRAFRQRAQAMLDKPGEFERVVGVYDGPQGDERFIDAITGLCNRQFGWNIGAENVAITNGSQSAFFCLFNLFAGPTSDNGFRRILLPLAPEYIGYTDLGADHRLFRAFKPQIDELSGRQFKYRIDFDRLEFGNDTGAVCVSRPTNPTGNVLTDAEIDKLRVLCHANGVPLIIDGAYGTPFPNIIFNDVRPHWDENIILCLSLSKVGVPGVRTGIVIAAPDIIRRITAMTAVLNLSTCSYGQSLALDMVDSGEIVTLSEQVIQPYYRQRVERYSSMLLDRLDGLASRIHKPEGAIFLWLWNPGLPISSRQLYQKLKARDVFVIAGHHFFPGLDIDNWSHAHECLRISYAGAESVVENGLGIIAEVVRHAYSQCESAA